MGKKHYPIDVLVMDTIIHSGIIPFYNQSRAILDINDVNIIVIGDEVISATMKRNLSIEEVVISRVMLCRKKLSNHIVDEC